MNALLPLPLGEGWGEGHRAAPPSLAVRVPACKPEPLEGLAACGSKPSSRPPPSPRGRGSKTGAIAIALLIAGCATPGPGVEPVVPPELPTTTSAPVTVAPDWWKAFNDPRLDALIDEALRDNRDLARAIARIDESRAALRLAQSDRWPVVSAGASAARQRSSETGPVPLGGGSPWINDFRATLNVAYEIDLWGKYANSSAAARAELLATEHARATLRNSLSAQVAQSYAALRSLDAQLVVFKRAVVAQREGLRLQKVRFDAGDMSELDWRQLEAELLGNEAQIPRLERAVGETERALALVLGRSPRAVLERNIDRVPEDAPPLVAAGVPDALPSDLLQRRPDVMQAEARLRAAGARVDVARAAYFPSILLTSSLGKESTELSRLFDGPSTIFSVIASLTQPIWNAGALDARRDIALARSRQAELDYRDAIAAAFKELRDALAAHAEAQTTVRLTEQRSQALARASALTNLRFEGGIASRLDQIEAERAALASQSQLADARRALSAAQVDVFRALGGGWTAQR
jgi:outer membrane protein, multidrug efflux system